MGSQSAYASIQNSTEEAQSPSWTCWTLEANQYMYRRPVSVSNDIFAFLGHSKKS